MLIQHQHFGVPSVLGKKIQASLETMQLVVRLNFNPLTSSYEVYGNLETDYRFKILWERLWHYQFTVHLFYPEISLLRERSALVVELFNATGHAGEVLCSLN